ncbi:MAG: hypothetical protein LBR79_06145 [Oscillospiraceae bacterium]|nr:hypothetical protein [Oscillospiraceae bacterium]
MTSKIIGTSPPPMAGAKGITSLWPTTGFYGFLLVGDVEKVCKQVRRFQEHRLNYRFIGGKTICLK